MYRTVSSSTTNRPVLRLRILTNLFNALDRTSPVRYDTFIACVKYADAAGVVPAFQKQLVVRALATACGVPTRRACDDCCVCRRTGSRRVA